MVDGSAVWSGHVEELHFGMKIEGDVHSIKISQKLTLQDCHDTMG